MMTATPIADSPFLGAEFEFPVFSEEFPIISEMPDGRYLVAFLSVEFPEPAMAVYKVNTRIYAVDGTPAGSASTIFQGEQTDALGHPFKIQSVSGVALADGGYAIAWQVNEGVRTGSTLNSTSSVSFQVFNSDGTQRTSVRDLYIMPSPHEITHIYLTPYRDGFFASWTDYSDTSATGPIFGSLGVMGRAFDGNGNPLDRGGFDDARYLNQITQGHQVSPDLATLTDGSVVLAYEDNSGNGDIRVIVYDPSGNVLLPDFIAHQQTAGYQRAPDLTELADGRFAVMCHSQSPTGGDGLFVQMIEIDRSGAGPQPLFDGNPVHVANTGGSVTSIGWSDIVGTAGSGFFAAWVETSAKPGGGVPSERLLGQFFNADGTEKGEQIVIDSAYFGNGGYVDLEESDNGSIMMIWRRYDDGGSGGFAGVTLARFLAAPVEAEPGPHIVRGTTGGDTLKGTAGDDVILGLGGDDIIRAQDGNDQLRGGKGLDQLYGGKGADTFNFDTGDSAKSRKAADVIYDFTKADKIDLSGWDANSKKDGDQDFRFIGARDFHGKAGELHSVKELSDTWIEGDTNGDGKADFVIRLDDPFSLKESFFIV